MSSHYVTLGRRENQARLLGEYAIQFLRGDLGDPSPAVFKMVERLHLDSIACAVSAVACRTNAPTVLRREALEYPAAANRHGATLLGSRTRVVPEKAILANSSAAREWDSNGTNFGFNPKRDHTRGEFGHNDFYPVALAAAEIVGLDGRQTLRAMILLDEIRGRLAEVFGLKDHKIDHVVHGAIASAVTYGAVLGATPEQIESAVGQFVAHYIPFRAIRAGKQLSDSKGASAAVSTEMAIVAMRRAMRGFVGPADIFRNPEAIFCLFEKPDEKNCSPFDLVLSASGDDFAVMGMHFKLGLYEHQSAGAIQGAIDLLTAHPALLQSPDKLKSVRITIYQPAFGIIGDPAKRDPRTRQSADHSMVYIIATLMRKAFELGKAGWKELMLEPADYSAAALYHPLTRQIMERIDFRHGGREYDQRYPDGIPTTLEIEHETLGQLSSGLVMYPVGHARNTSGLLDELLEHKFQLLAGIGVKNPHVLYERFTGLADKSAADIALLHDFEILDRPGIVE